MKDYKKIILYVTVIGVFAFVIYFLINHGKTLETGRTITEKTVSSNESLLYHFNETIKDNVKHPMAILLLQILTIIFTARTFGFLFNKIGQPTVIGEILAGIFLGPSLLGMWIPEFSTFMFPKESLGNLQLLSQIGLVLFMFVIGMELDFKVLKTKTTDALVISHIGIIIPYTMGFGLSFFIYEEFAPPTVDFISFALFMGIAMSIAAFPVMARIIQERNLTKTKLGTLAITCAASDDITAWCILAAVIAIVKAGTITGALFTIGLSIIYLILMIKLVQPFLKKFGEVYSNKESLSLNIVATIFGILLISSLTTEVLGIHPLFGAFLAGAIMPPSINFRRLIIEKIESVSLGLFLPLFFVFTGLRTQIGLLNTEHLWYTCAVVIGIAILGKFGGSMLAAKLVGNSWKTSLSIGAFMNTRGLMELVVLNIGYDLGILSPEIFAIMVLMALFTTFMTGPSLDLINYVFRKDVEEVVAKTKQKFRILLSFANPQSGKKLARVANLVSGYSKNSTEIMALHVTPSADINQYQLAEYEKESFKPIKSEANKIGLSISTTYKVSNDVSEEILSDANSGAYDLMLVGVGQSVFEGTLLGQFIGITANALSPDKLLGTLTGRSNSFKTQNILDEKSNAFINNSKIPVGIFIDHEMDQVEKVLLPIVSISDVFLLFYAKKIIKNSNVHIAIVDYNGIIEANTEIKEEITNLENYAPNNMQLISRKDWDIISIYEHNLIVLSIDGFNVFSKDIVMGEKETPSFLLIRP
ncbi:MAG: cation:proton antiporter [Sphingobacteriaceae bacterium]|nr:cation:proton antiporter [Sphingobacteriaceae bacterium]